MARPKQWMLRRETPGPALPDEAEKREIVAACEALIRDVLKPRHLRHAEPANRNHLVDIHGAWAAGRYRFVKRYRSGFEQNRGEEFEMPALRIDRMGPDNFDVHWMRHTGQWRPMASGKTLAEALRIIEEDAVVRFSY